MKSMNKIIFLSFLLFAVLTAQEADKSAEIKSAVDKLFELCKNNDFEKTALLTAYSGKDEARNLTDTYNYKEMKEAATVKRISKKIKAFLDISDKYNLGTLKEESNDKGKFISIEIIFVSGNQELKTLFSFVNVKGKLLLADLN